MKKLDTFQLICLAIFAVSLIGFCLSDKTTTRDIMEANAKKLISAGVSPTELGKYNTKGLRDSKMCCVCGKFYGTYAQAIACCSTGGEK